MQVEKEARRGIVDGLPVILGYLPYGIAFGLLAKQASLTLWATLAMSAFVYAGTAQFIAVAMLQNQQTLWAITLATFIVNSRYILMNGALTQKCLQWPTWKRFLVSYYVSDETFVVMSNRHKSSPLTPAYALGLNFTGVFGWTTSSVMGFAIGQRLPNLDMLGFDFALIAVLIALATMLVKDKLSLIVAGAAGLIAIGLNLLGYANFSILVAALAASVLGVVLAWKRKTLV